MLIHRLPRAGTRGPGPAILGLGFLGFVDGGREALPEYRVGYGEVGLFGDGAEVNFLGEG